MAVERTGTAQTFATTLSSDSFSLAVPGDATLAVVFFSGYSTTPYNTAFNNGQYSVTIGGQACTHVNRSTTVSDNRDIACSILVNPPTGSQTMAISISGTVLSGNFFTVVYYKGVDTDNPILDSGGSDNSGSMSVVDLVFDRWSMTVFGVSTSNSGAVITGNDQVSIITNGPDPKQSNTYVLVGEKLSADYISVTSATDGGMVALSIAGEVPSFYYDKYWNSNYMDDGGDVTITENVNIVPGDVILLMWSSAGYGSSDVLTVSNTGTALTWVPIRSEIHIDNCHAAAWYAISTVTQSMNVTVESNQTDSTHGVLACIVHKGAHQTNPVPSNKVYSGYNTTDVSQSITPTTSIGSCLWMLCADFNETNSFVARANCTIDNFEDFGGWANMALIRPTVQPQTGGAAFTIGETDSSGKITWIALEVQAAEVVIPVSVAWFSA